MRKLFLILFILGACLATNAQTLILKNVAPQPQDTRARTQPRNGGNGEKCAIIRVGVVGVEDMKFPDAVGNVERLLSEYIVYVPSGLKRLKYESSSNKGEVVFSQYGIDIESQSSYKVTFESENKLRSAIFSVTPNNAQLYLNGEKVNIGSDGMAMINKPVGVYQYKISADGFETMSGTVELKDDEISTHTDIALQAIMHKVTINVYPENATVFIDNSPYTKEEINNLQLSEGKHSVRVTAMNYEEEKHSIYVDNHSVDFFFTLKESKSEVVKHKEERTRTSINIRNANYITFGAESLVPKLSNDMDFVFWGLKVSYDYVGHFGGMFAIRTGFGASLFDVNYNKKTEFEGKEILEDTLIHVAVDIPLQLGICLPFGKYNQHLFSVFAGGYGRAVFLIGGEEEADKYRETLSDDHFELKRHFYDFGLRAGFKLDISRFTIGADVGQSLNGYGFSGAVTLGWKIYSFKPIE